MSGQAVDTVPIAMLGLNHKATPVEVRERVAFGPERILSALHELARNDGEGPIREIVLLSTCNRTEIYIHGRDLAGAESLVQDFLTRNAHMSVEQLKQMQYAARGAAAALHLMQVAAGLDSLVFGENEILGQVRSASELAQSAGTNGPILSALFRYAIQAGKRVRTETTLGSERLSVASVVVELAGKIMGPLTDRTALLIGAGKISSLTGRALARAGLRCILIANRTFERAQKLAKTLNGSAVHFDALDASLARADIVICSTGAPHLVLHADTVFKAQQARNGRPLLVADLAVPRDADPAIAAVPGVHLANMDDLEAVIKSSSLLTPSVHEAVEGIFQEELESFRRWCGARRSVALIQALNQKAEQIYQSEAEQTLRRLGPLNSRQEHLVQAMAKAIAGKLLHEPIVCLRELPRDEDISSYIDLVQDLYGLQ